MSEVILAGFLLIVGGVVLVVNVAWRRPARGAKYVDYVTSHPEKIERGLFLQCESFGMVDVAWTDHTGVIGAVVREGLVPSGVDPILAIRGKFLKRAGTGARFYIVSTVVSDEMRGLLDGLGVGWREVPWP